VNGTKRYISTNLIQIVLSIIFLFWIRGIYYTGIYPYEINIDLYVLSFAFLLILNLSYTVFYLSDDKIRIIYGPVYSNFELPVKDIENIGVISTGGRIFPTGYIKIISRRYPNLKWEVKGDPFWWTTIIVQTRQKNYVIGYGITISKIVRIIRQRYNIKEQPLNLA
jgi:hypothetical protein